MRALRRAAVLLLCAVLPAAALPGAGAAPAGEEDAVYFRPGGDGRIALTFDDGPHPAHTAEILDILAEYGVRATFFVVGENAERWPELVRREAREGHEIGNHTYSHADLSEADDKAVACEIERGERAVWENFEYRTRLLRPPGGCFDGRVSRAARERDYTVVCWSVDTRDWAHTPTDEIVSNVMKNTESGDILLFHDYIAGDSPTPDALRQLIPRLLSAGYRFVTVSELLGDA